MWTWLIRVSGLLAWWLLALDVLIGSVIAGNLATYTVMGNKKLVWHRHLGYALAGMVAIHVIMILGTNLGGYRSFSAWGPANGTLARNAGVVAFVLLAVVVVTSALKSRIGRTWWARGHLLTLPVLIAGTVHGINAGPDATSFLVVIPGVAVVSFMFSAASNRVYKNWIRARGNSRKRGHVLSILARPHGLHYRGPVTREVPTVRAAPTRRKPLP